MIKSIVVSGKHHVAVTNSDYLRPAQSGLVHYDPQTGDFRVMQEQYSGTPTFHKVESTTVDIQLTQQAEAAIDWAIQKMTQERDIEDLCRSNPALAELRDKFEVLVALTRKGS